MVRLRLIKRWGNSLVVVLSPTDTRDIGVREGDFLDIEDSIVFSKDLKKLKEAVEK